MYLGTCGRWLTEILLRGTWVHEKVRFLRGRYGHANVPNIDSEVPETVGKGRRRDRVRLCGSSTPELTGACDAIIQGTYLDSSPPEDLPYLFGSDHLVEEAKRETSPIPHGGGMCDGVEGDVCWFRNIPVLRMRSSLAMATGASLRAWIKLRDQHTPDVEIASPPPLP